jgi:hypothetical protein
MERLIVVQCGHEIGERVHHGRHIANQHEKIKIKEEEINGSIKYRD